MLASFKRCASALFQRIGLANVYCVNIVYIHLYLKKIIMLYKNIFNKEVYNSFKYCFLSSIQYRFLAAFFFRFLSPVKKFESWSASSQKMLVATPLN